MKKEKKVLMYMEEFYLAPKGGPAGYLYNLKTELDKGGINNIEFLKGEDRDKKKRDILKRMPKFFKKVFYVLKRANERRILFENKEKMATYDLSKYDIIHFHSTKDLFKVKDSLKNYKGKVILTTHTPKPSFLEEYEDKDLCKIERIMFKIKYLDKYKMIDEFAFKRADYIIFPCEEAEEPYFNNWKEYRSLRKDLINKYRYIETGINDCIIKENRGVVREKYGIPNEAFVVSYIGRHNKTKGYDDLKEIGKRMLKNKKNYFLVGGKEQPIQGLKDTNWIEVGWTNDPYSIIGASDVFILPNKETYFDIVMLEILALQKIVIASETGGNKFFRRDKGILLYKTIDEAIQNIEKIKKMNIEERKNLELANRKLYESKFTSEKFLEKYLNLIEGL